MPHDQLATLWNHVTGHLRASISPDAYARWFSSLKLQAAGDDAVRILVPDSIHQLWIEMNYLSALQSAFGAITGMTHAFQFEVDPSLRQKDSPDGAGWVRATDAPVSDAAEAPPMAAAVADILAVEGPGTTVPERLFESQAHATAEGLQPLFSFDSFVVGASNQFAHAAARAVAERPGRSYNPLFFYGGSGLGKTHLMHAIGLAVRSRKPRARVIYITSEEFTNQFINALQTHSIARFRRRFRQADVLLIDDVHFLAGKERSQEEFFHTFNALLGGHKQIVLSSDRPACDIADLENRLVTRFEWGHTTELTPPDEETRLAIMRKKAESLETEVPAHLMEFIASRIHSDVRRLQGALVRVASWISLHGPMNLTQAEVLLRDLLQQEAKNQLTIDRIQKGVAANYDIRLADMVSRKRPAGIAFPRQIAMYLARELTGQSYQEIGSAFGGRDHGTIMHACRCIERRIKDDERLRHRVAGIETQLRRAM
jgi:chromosomal replication initiator protein